MSDLNVKLEIARQKRLSYNRIKESYIVKRTRQVKLKTKKEQVKYAFRLMERKLNKFKEMHEALVKAVTEEEKLTLPYFSNDFYGRFMRRYKIERQKVRLHFYKKATPSISIKENLPNKVDLEQAMTIQHKRYLQISKAYETFLAYSVKKYNWLYANLELDYLETIWINFKSMHEELDFVFPETMREPLPYYRENKFDVTKTIYLKLKSGLQNILDTHKNTTEVPKTIKTMTTSEAVEVQIKRYTEIQRKFQRYCTRVTQIEDDPTKIVFRRCKDSKRNFSLVLEDKKHLEEIWEDCKATHELIVNAVNEQQQSLHYVKDNMIKKIENLYTHVRVVLDIVSNKIWQPLLKCPFGTACSEDLRTALNLQYSLFKQLEHNKGKVVLHHSNEQIYLDNMWEIFQATDASIGRLASSEEKINLPYFKDDMLSMYQSLYLTIRGTCRKIYYNPKVEPYHHLVLFMPISELCNPMEYNDFCCDCLKTRQVKVGRSCPCKRNIAQIQARKSLPSARTHDKDKSILVRYYTGVNNAILGHDWDRLLFFLLNFPTRGLSQGFQSAELFDVYTRAYTILLLNHPSAQTQGLLMEYFHMILGCRTDEDKKAFMKILVSLTKKLRVRNSKVMQEVYTEREEQDTGSDFEMEF